MATRTTTILFIQPVSERGGSDHALLRMIRRLPPDRFSCHVALPSPSPMAAEFEATGAHLHTVPMRRISTSHGAIEWLAYRPAGPGSGVRAWRLARPPPAAVA